MPDFISHQDLIRREWEFEKRHETRAHRYMLVSYRPEGEPKRPHLTVSMDVSAEGMSIWTERPIPQDTVLELSICRPGSLEVYRAHAKVRWSKKAPGGRTRTGLAVVSSVPPGRG